MSIAVAAGFLALAAAATSPCESPANPVVRENCLPGSPSSEWDVNGDGHADIFVPSEVAPNELLLNDGEGGFVAVMAPPWPAIIRSAPRLQT